MNIKVLEKLLVLSGIVLCIALYWKFGVKSFDSVRDAPQTLIQVEKNYSLKEQQDDAVDVVHSAEKIEEPPSLEVIEETRDVYIVQRGDSFLNILEKRGIPNKFTIVQAISKVENLSWDASKILPGDPIEFVQTEEKSTFTIEIDKDKSLIVEYNPSIQAYLDVRETEKREELISMKIEGSFWKTASKMGFTSKQIYNLATLFDSHIDFATEIYGDEEFVILAERVLLNKKPIRIENVNVALLNRDKNSIRLYKVKIDKEEIWLDEKGRIRNRPFLRSPVEYSYISSKYGVKRSKGYHGGVDFAAKKGIPVRTVADGVVKLASWNGGYGKQVQVEHSKYGPYLTSYAHLSKINVKKNQRVKQGDIIGLVGSTGNSTGPHVHYELKVRNKRVNPMEYPLPYAKEISKEQKKLFLIQKAEIEKRMEAFEKLETEP